MGLKAYDVTLDRIRELVEIEPLIARHDRDLADQLHRAASSTLLNLGEGSRSDKGNRHKHFALAHGSAGEVKSALQLARAWRWVSRTEPQFALLDRVLAMLWKLTH